MRQPRVRLRYDLKSVEEGPWSEENAPEYTVFSTVFLYSPIRSHNVIKNLLENEEWKKIAGGSVDEEAVEKYVESTLQLKEGTYLIIGGHETIGRGIIRLIKVI